MLFSADSNGEQVITMHGDLVWRVIVRLLGDDGELAEDCFQETFTQYLQRSQGGGNTRHAGALLARIAARRAIDAIRSRVRERGRRQPFIEETIESDMASQPSLQAEGSEFLTDLRLALADLPEKQAAAFVLTQIEDLSHDEAGQALRVTANHVRVLVHRARVALRARLASHQFHSDEAP